MKKFLGLILLMLLPCSALSMWGQTGQQMKLISYNIWNGFEGDSLRRARFIEWTQKHTARASAASISFEQMESAVLHLGRLHHIMKEETKTECEADQSN